MNALRTAQAKGRKNRVSMLSGECGNAKLFTVLGIAALLYIFKNGNQVFGPQFPPALRWCVIALLSIVTLFSLLCSIHMRMLGMKPNRQLYNELQVRLSELEKVLADSHRKSRLFEENMVSHVSIMSRKGTEYLSTLKKVVRALERRMVEVKGLMSTKDSFDLLAAYDLMNERLEVSGNSLESIIDSDPLPALESFEWQSTIDRLAAQISGELAKAAEVQAQLRKVA